MRMTTLFPKRVIVRLDLKSNVLWLFEYNFSLINILCVWHQLCCHLRTPYNNMPGQKKNNLKHLDWMRRERERGLGLTINLAKNNLKPILGGINGRIRGAEVGESGRWREEGRGKEVDEVKRVRIIFQMHFWSWIKISRRRQFKSTDAKQLLVIAK